MSSLLLVIAVLVLTTCSNAQSAPNYWVYPCDQTPGKDLPFCDTSLSFEERAKDFVMRLNITESIGVSGHENHPIPRLNITHYDWWSDAAHGLCQGINWNKFPTHSATMFPQTIGTGTTLNETLWYLIGDAISTEGRAFWNYNSSGLTFWDPNINIYRDPRWGRGQETPGEDPFINSRYGVRFVRGMQGNDAKYLKLSTTCKHWDAYSLENYDGVTRHKFNAIVSDFDLNDTYLVPMRYCAIPDAIYGGNSSGIMCSYNEVNGVPSCANDYLLNELIEEYNFNGYVTSDCSAVNDVYENHHYTTNPGETCQAVFQSGMNIECGSFVQGHGVAAINDGYFALSDLQYGLIKDYTVLMRLGMFDEPSSIPWYKNGPNNSVNTPLHQEIALNAAQQSIVLLKNNQNDKNDANTLPIDLSKSGFKNIAIFGPNANNTKVLGGNYAGKPPFVVTPLESLQSYAAKNNIKVSYNKGVDMNSNKTNGFAISEQYAASSDLTILVMGLDESVEAEGKDRYYLTLPGMQNEFIINISTAAKNNNAIVLLVIISGGCVDISNFTQQSTNDKLVDAILWAGYGGMYGGTAIMDVTFGTFNPTGMTTQTWYYNEYVNEASMFDMGMRPSDNNYTNINQPNPGRGYRYYGGRNILYPFGYGLSYTTFKCDNFKVFNNNMSVSVDVTNTGNTYNSGAVVMIYYVPKNNGTNGIPIKRLVAFNRIHMLNTGATYNGLNMLIYEQFFWSDEYQSGNGQFMMGGVCDSDDMLISNV